MNLDEYLSGLDPKTAKRVKTAQEIELIKYPLASIGLTNALGGGIGGGRITLCYGNTSSGKSVLFMQSVAQWQKMGLVCAYVDVEGTYEKAWAARLGIDNDNLILIQSKSAAKIEDEIRPHLEQGIDIIIIDSISDILPEVFIGKDGEMLGFDGRKQMGAHAKAITNLCNGIHYLNERTAVVLISQTTTMIEQTYVKQIPHGGKKTGFAASQIIKLTSSNTENQQIKGELLVGDRLIDQPVGRKVDYLVEKNKMGRAYTKGLYDLYYAGDFVGIDTVGEVLDLAEGFGLVEKKGAWYYYGDQSFQGRAKFIAELNTNDEVREALTRRVTAMMTGELVEV